MIGISFDLSRKSTGIALWRGVHPIKVSTLSLPDGYLGEQLDRFDVVLAKTLKVRQPDWIAYEDARAVSKQHGQILFGMVGVLLMNAWRLGIQVEPVNQMTVKHSFTGSGKATKTDMLLFAQRLYPELDVKNHDEADAVAVGQAFLKRIKKL